MSAATTQKKSSEIMLCPDCDLLLTRVDPSHDTSVICPRCRFQFRSRRTHSMEKVQALALTGLLVYLPANFYPLLSFDMLGTTVKSSVVTSTINMFSQGQYLVGIVVTFTALVLPLSVLGLLFSVATALRQGWTGRWIAPCLRSYLHLTEWAMTDVYLIGVLITIIKMGHSTTITYNTGFYCFIFLVLTTLAAQTSVDRPLFWKQLEKNRPSSHNTPPLQIPVTSTTGIDAGLVLCRCCHKLLPVAALKPAQARCSRCGEHLHQRKQGSITRSWALLITSLILFIPANMLPMMEVQYFGQPEDNTILDGIIYFFQDGSYGIGAVILTASILVPLFKISGLSLILLSIQFGWTNWLTHQTIMFRFIDFIGRWSMLDIFVIALLSALVRFGYLSSINAASAAVYFTGVVLCTMFAAISFDSRLLWDTINPPSVPKAHAHATP